MIDKIRIFTSEFCPPCQELKNKLTSRELEKIEWVDIHTDKGFKEAMAKKILGVPYAEKDGKRCKVLFTNNNVVFDCGKENG